METPLTPIPCGQATPSDLPWAGRPPVFIGLGTNLGDRWANLRRAVAAVTPSVRIERVSPVYETEALYVTEQPAFLNAVLMGQSDRSASQLLSDLKRVEQDMGREPGLRYGPRLIDLDILFFGSQRLSLPNLEIPHPRLTERAFVLIPMRALAPNLVHPTLGMTIAELAAAVPGVEGVQEVGDLIC